MYSSSLVSLRGINTFSREITLLFYFSFEKGSPLKGKNLLPAEANSLGANLSF